jgi:competence protein ComFC
MNLIKTIFDFLISIILPKNEEILYLESLSASDLLDKVSLARTMEKDRFLAIFDYKDPLARKIIWQIKYKDNRIISHNLAILLYDLILEEISDETSFSRYQQIIIIPIPCSTKRFREKGFNQTEILAKELQKIDENNYFKLDLKILKKIKDTPHQVSVKNREKRLKNLEGSFSVNENVDLKKTCIILIDDVITTGATMSEARKVLKSAGAKKVICVAVAH